MKLGAGSKGLWPVLTLSLALAGVLVGRASVRLPEDREARPTESIESVVRRLIVHSREQARQAAPAPTSVGESAVDPDGLIGWGAAQPPNMKNPVLFGRTSEPLSPERRKHLGDQLDRARDAALKVGTVVEALDAGYEPVHGFVHGRGVEFVKFSALDDRFDIDEPEILTFPDAQPTTRVAGLAYNVLGSRETGPPTDLPLEVIPWHFHYDICEKDGVYIGSETFDCEANGGRKRPEIDNWMVDLWVVPGWENPWGLASSRHPDLFAFPWFQDPAAPPGTSYWTSVNVKPGVPTPAMSG